MLPAGESVLPPSVGKLRLPVSQPAGIGEVKRQAFTGSPNEFFAQAETYKPEGRQQEFIRLTLEELPPERLPEFLLESISEEGVFHVGGQGVMITDTARDFALETAERVWLERDPHGALAWALSLSLNQRRLVVNGMMNLLAETDGATGLKLLAELPPDLRKGLSKDFAYKLSSADPAAAFALASKSPAALQENLTKIFSNWGLHDPVAANAALLTLPADMQAEARVFLLGSWATKDPAAALKVAEAIPQADLRRAATKTAFEGWASSDPLEACDWAMSQPPAVRNTLHLDNLARSLAQKDLRRANALVESLPMNRRGNVYQGIADGLAHQDVESALAWMETLSDASAKGQVLTELGNKLKGQDPDRLLKLSQFIADRDKRLNFLSSAVGGGEGETSPGDICSGISDPGRFAALYQILPALPPEDAADFLRKGTVFSELADDDPLSAAALLTEYRSDESTNSWEQVGTAYARKDPSAAYAWAMTLPAKQKAAVLPVILRSMAQTDAPAALKLADQMEDQSTRSDTLKHIIDAWEPSALTQLLSETHGDIRQKVLRQVISSKIGEDPAAAANYILSLPQNGNPEDAEIFHESIGTLAYHWIQQAPTEAADFASKLNGAAYDAYIRSLSETWVQNDAIQASVWIRDLPSGDGKDVAIENLARAIRKSDPAAAVIWAEQIQGDFRKKGVLLDVLEAYVRRDPVAGGHAVEAADISPEAKARLLKKP